MKFVIMLALLVAISGCSSAKTTSYFKCDTYGNNKIYAKVLFDKIYMLSNTRGDILLNDCSLSGKYLSPNEIEMAIISGNINRQEITRNYDEFIFRINRLNEDFDIKYNTYVNEKSNILIKYVISDNSGYYDNSINFGEIYYLKANEVNFVKNVEFESEPTGLQQALEKQYNKVISDNNVNLEAFTYYKMNNKNSGSKNKFNYTSKYDTNVLNTKSNREIPVNIIITSKDFGFVYPNIRYKDHTIAIETIDGYLKLENLTSKHITVKSLSFYGGSDVITHNFENNIELPPHTYKNDIINIDNFLRKTALYSEYIFNGMSKKDASNSKVNVGIAVKYTIGNKNIESTLYIKKNLLLSDVLANKRFNL